jgi:uncharacterized membrane protein HdeD (DUF308 family)
MVMATLKVPVTLTFTIFLGWLFLISGGIGLITTYRARGVPGFWWSFASAVLSVVVGVLMLLWPVSGAISLTLVLATFFILDGFALIMYALPHREQLTGQWGWLMPTA